MNNDNVKYSFVVPVYNRPDEVNELLGSLARQTLRCFEVIIVEDGSNITCKNECAHYVGKLHMRYYSKSNSGPGQTRNFGVEHARGEWVIVVDSDVVLPDGYLQAVDDALSKEEIDAFGGPDRAHPSFTDTQKAISYSMTSFFTTGGIRGGKKKLDKFYPRSYNMGIRRSVYMRLGGFSEMRFGEDIDFSIRLFEAGCKVRLLPDAWVWHKRRTDFRKFYRQVYNSGAARITLHKLHPGSMKLVHLLPAVFTIGVSLLVFASVVGLALTYISGSHIWRLLFICPLIPIIIYGLVILIGSTVKNRHLGVGLLSVPSAFIQLIGYGNGFLSAWWHRCVLGQSEYYAFRRTFYK